MRSWPPWPSLNSAEVSRPPPPVAAMVGWVAGWSMTTRWVHCIRSAEVARWHVLAAVVDGQVVTGRADDHLGGVHPVPKRVMGVVAECGGGTHITKQPGQPVTAGWLRHRFLL